MDLKIPKKSEENPEKFFIPGIGIFFRWMGYPAKKPPLIPIYIIILQFRCKYESRLRPGHKKDHKYRRHLLGKKARVMAVVSNA